MSSKHYSNGLWSWLGIINTALTIRSKTDKQIIDAIRKASPVQIAEWLKVYQSLRRGESPYDYGLIPPLQTLTQLELDAIVDRVIELLKEKEVKQ